jgi:hypothetical protein
MRVCVLDKQREKEYVCKPCDAQTFLICDETKNVPKGAAHSAFKRVCICIISYCVSAGAC